ncbi:MAG: CoA-binding protein [Paracoccaceae bacterium]
MTTPEPTDTFLREILTRTTSIAAVGASQNPVRPSFYVTRYLMLKGYRLSFVNPRYAGQEIMGHPVHESLAALPSGDDPIEMVDIFRRSEEAGGVVDEAIAALADRGLRTIWMQVGVIDEAAADRARAAGLDVVMNRCPKIEYQRLFGELRMGGFATGQISSRRR